MPQRTIPRHRWAALLAVVLLLSVSSIAAASSAAGRHARVASGPAQISTATPQPPGQPARTAPPLSLTLTLLFTCCSVGLVVGVIVLGFVVAISNRKSQAGTPPPSPPSA